MSTTDRERQRRNFRRWYQRHRDEHLRALHHRRRTDPDFAERRRESTYKYFREHREEINEERRERMATDPAYAAARKAYSAAYWKKLKDGYVPQPRPLDDGSERVYRQSEAARLAGCSGAAIIKWIRHGWLPEPDQLDGRKVFTREQVDLIAWFASVNPHDFDARSEVSAKIWKLW